jgi:hypothetical protein
VGTALLGLVLRMLSGGWLFIPGSPIYLAIGMAHTLFHFRALRSIEQAAIQPLAILSNCLLLTLSRYFAAV